MMKKAQRLTILLFKASKVSILRFLGSAQVREILIQYRTSLLSLIRKTHDQE